MMCQRVAWLDHGQVRMAGETAIVVRAYLDAVDEGLVEDVAPAGGLTSDEAEAVTLLCVESLGMDGAAYCRGYLQHWLSGQVIPEASAQRVFKIADQILRAGRADKAGAA